MPSDARCGITSARAVPARALNERPHMHGIIYLIGLIVVVLAILSFLGLG